MREFDLTRSPLVLALRQSRAVRLILEQIKPVDMSSMGRLRDMERRETDDGSWTWRRE